MTMAGRSGPKNAQAAATCACGVHAGGRKALKVDPDLKAANLTHLRRIEGQMRGLIRMVEEDRYCADIVTQVSAVRESLQSVARTLLKNHLRHCATATIRSGETEADAMYDELLDLVSRMSR
jgi:CsoR family transcriptional regulator, copper-sensing transcriptional repressor